MAQSRAKRVNGYVVYLHTDDGRRGHVNPFGVFVTDYTVTPDPDEWVVVFHNGGGNTSKSFAAEAEADAFAKSVSPETGFGYSVQNGWIPNPHVDFF